MSGKNSSGDRHYSPSVLTLVFTLGVCLQFMFYFVFFAILRIATVLNTNATNEGFKTYEDMKELNKYLNIFKDNFK